MATGAGLNPTKKNTGVLELSLSSRPFERQHGRPLPQSVQIIAPRLHHRPTLLQVRRAVVGPPQRVSHRMGKLLFDDVGRETQHFVQNSSRHRAEPVPGHFVLAVP